MSDASKKGVLARMASERGASLAIGLLLILVCVALSAAILAATTASVGQFANQNEKDQKYYSVISATQLFRDTILENSDLEYTQEITGKNKSGTPDLGYSKYKSCKPGLDNTLKSFLPKLTCLALSGSKDGNATGTVKGQFYEPRGFDDIECIVKPSGISDLPDDAPDTPEVKVTASFDVSDWTLTLKFASSTTDNPYTMSLVLVADVRQEEQYREAPVNTNVSGALSSTETAVHWERTTHVEWHLQQIITGADE